MVSRRNFISIIVMMAVLLFMFQFSQIIKETDSDYDVNAYALEEAAPYAPKWQTDSTEADLNVSHGVGQKDNIPKENLKISASGGKYAVFCGSEKGKVYPVIEQWCIYTKRGLAVYADPGDYVPAEENLPDAVLIDSAGINLAVNVSAFSRWTDLGIALIFCNLPDAAELKGKTQLCELLGIRKIPSERIEVEGMHLFPGFLLGGEMWYMETEEKKNQDLELNIPWYITAGGTKTYMVGILEDLLKEEEAKNEYFPPLIWRNSYGNSKVFVVNGDYLSDMTGLGILDAMMYEADSYAVYPIVNAQNALVTNYPEFAGENDAVMMELYSRKMSAVQRDVCWPDLAALIERNKLKLTCLFAPQYNYLDDAEPSGESIRFYLQQLRETGAEAGMSLAYGEGITLREKLARDEPFYDSMNRYLFTSAFITAENMGQLEDALSESALLKSVRTAAGDYPRNEPVISWREPADYGNGITIQSVTSDVKTHTYSNDLFVRSLETALGYSNVRIDMHDVLWPQSKEDQWENMYDNMASNLNTYWKPFSAFAQTTLTESDRRIRIFLNLDYRDRREGDSVYLEMSGAEEGWFLFRVHGEEIASISGAQYQEIESGAYLLHVTEERVEICLRKNRGLIEYTYP